MYSRAHPSPRYQHLIAQYQSMHREGEQFLNIPPEKTFPGQSLLPQVARVKAMIDRCGAKLILDYGCGKGLQYRPLTLQGSHGRTWPSVQAFWGVERIACYDPCYTPFSTLPQGKFDGVISTDVLEHCAEEDIDWIIDEMFGYAVRFVFANVACYPAKKRLPTGENAHITVHPKPWWERKLGAIAARHPSVAWEVWIQSIENGALIEECIGS